MIAERRYELICNLGAEKDERKAVRGDTDCQGLVLVYICVNEREKKLPSRYTQALEDTRAHTHYM